MAISDKAWGQFAESDYTDEQWYAACLIKPPRSEYTAKAQCKLPVLEPNGDLNRNGVHAAAGALAGARGGIQATPEQKRAAARAIVRYYSQLEEQPPDSIIQMAR